jgi:hypothetical protein
VIGRPLLWAVAAGLVASAAACSSSPSRPGAVSASTLAPASLAPTSPPSTAPTTVAGQVPTVPNCGGGAYEPRTLLIVCGVGTTMATGVAWSSWTASTATGNGDVHLTTGGQQVVSPAVLQLSEVRYGSNGPQFSLLTVTWTGPSPDGRPTDTFHLAE